MPRTRTAKEMGLSPPYARHAMAYVLAGGRGSRLLELTDRRAKPAVYFARQVAHHRLRAVQRAEFRHPPHRGRDAVQGPQPDPPPAARLELPQARAKRELRHPAGLAARLRDDVVSGHRRRGLSEHRHHRELQSPLHGRARRRPRLQDGLREDAAAARRLGRGRDGRMPRGLARGGQGLRRDARRRRQQHHRVPREAAEPAAHARQARRGAGQHGHLRLRDVVPDRPPEAGRGRSRLRRTTSARTSSPTSSRTAKPSRITSPSPASARPRRRRHYWRDVGTVDAYWEANIDLTDVVPDLDLYDRGWPIWTYGEITPPAKFVHDVDGRRGLAIQSLLSGGCIVSGAAISRSLRVHRRPRPFLLDDPRGGHPALRLDRAARPAQQGGDRQRGAPSPTASSSARIRCSTPSASVAPRAASRSSPGR